MLDGLAPAGHRPHRAWRWLLHFRRRLPRPDQPLGSGRPSRETILDGLPGGGNYHTNMVAAGADGWLYFGQGAMTNSGVVGADAIDLAWLRRLQHPVDIPGLDIALAGAVFETEDPREDGARATTAAFAPFGDAAAPGARIAGRLPCTAAVMRCRPDGSSLELVAWGLRNPFGLGFLADGRLLATDQGADDRGSRPIGCAPDLFFEVKPGAWYGWPDYRRRTCRSPIRASARPAARSRASSSPVTTRFRRPRRPLFSFAVNAAATKFAVLPAGAPRWPGQLIVAIFGDEKPMTAPPGPRVGRSLLRLDPEGLVGRIRSISGRFDRPIDVIAADGGETLIVLDFGHFEMREAGALDARAGSGRLWKLRLI